MNCWCTCKSKTVIYFVEAQFSGALLARKIGSFASQWRKNCIGVAKTLQISEDPELLMKAQQLFWLISCVDRCYGVGHNKRTTGLLWWHSALDETHCFVFTHIHLVFISILTWHILYWRCSVDNIWHALLLFSTMWWEHQRPSINL